MPQRVAAGDGHTLAICNELGTVRAWGQNNAGQLGNGLLIDSPVPVSVSWLTGITAVAAGDNHSLALKYDGTVYAWGSNLAGQLGVDIQPNSPVPVEPEGLASIAAIAAGMGHNMALAEDGIVWTWGFNGEGELGNGTWSNINMFPAPVPGLDSVIAIAAGSNHSLVLRSNGTVWTFGWNLHGQLGTGTYMDSPVPVQVPGLTDVIAISGGARHSMALRSDHTLWMWGENLYGQLGNGSTVESIVPIQVALPATIVKLAAAPLSVGPMVLDSDGHVWAWGLYGNALMSNVPVQVPDLSDALDLCSGNMYNIVEMSDSSLHMWGLNNHGQLGVGTTVTNDVPVALAPICSFASVQEVSSPDRIDVYPSPTTDAVQLKSARPLHDAGVELFNAQGSLVERWTCNGTRQRLDISAQPAGVYSVLVSTPESVFRASLVKE